MKRKRPAASSDRARAAPAIHRAAGRYPRRTASKRSATAARPSSACGTRMLHELAPKSRADRSITQSEAGGLSTVMKFEASKEPKKNAFQLFAPASTAAE